MQRHYTLIESLHHVTEKGSEHHGGSGREAHAAHLEAHLVLERLDLRGHRGRAHRGVVVRKHVPGLRQQHQRLALRRERALALGGRVAGARLCG
jgi:hypothetical protein